MTPVKMYDKRTTNLVDAYAFYNDKTVLIFNPYSARKNQGNNGWEVVARKNLIPAEYVDLAGNFLSKTERNKIKERLSLTRAVWECTDGESYTDIEEAIAHEKKLMGESDDFIEGEAE